jgi:hypothetical protein
MIKMTNVVALFLYGAAYTNALTLKRDSYSAEQALAQLDEEAQLMKACLCARYNDGASAADGDFGEIEDGVYIEDVDADGDCKVGVRAITGFVGDNTDFHKYVEVTNQSCLYKIWMCSCWASQTAGCLCARENADNTVTMVKP